MVVGLLGFITVMAFTTKRVADFLAANRCAGRYLLCVASGGQRMPTAVSFSSRMA